MQSRLIEVTGGKANPSSPIQFQRVGLWDAAEQEFSLAAAGGITNAMAVRGSHVLISTQWGLFELHTQCPDDRYESQIAEIARLLQDVKLTAPVIAEAGPATAQTVAASPIHGVWKAFRSRLRLSSSGSIEIFNDRAQVISAPVEVPQAVTPDLLRGRYRADGDLLFVQWQDGSKLNFRWKSHGGDLLLTDHDGQISKLRRIAE